MICKILSENIYAEQSKVLRNLHMFAGRVVFKQ